jgi:AraC-like DNA-binding protein
MRKKQFAKIVKATPEVFTPFAPVGMSVVQGVRLVELLYNRAGFEFTATSLPGHLIHLVVSGHVRQEMNGRWHDLRAGDAVWYHEDELVRGKVLKGPWRFYTCNFIAPTLSPPPFEHRVWRVGLRPRAQFESLLQAWQSADSPPAVREMRVQGRLLELLATLWHEGRGQPYAVDPSARLWWDIETRLREDLSQPISLSLMESLSHRSRATIMRSCVSAVGVTPMRRVKQIRLSLARGLVQRSDLQIKEIADRIGYGRVHEFSRDYRKHFGMSARDDRKRGDI